MPKFLQKLLVKSVDEAIEHAEAEPVMNPMAWTYVWWNEEQQLRQQKAYSSAGDALGAAYAHLEGKERIYPFQIWHKGWVMFNHRAIEASHEKYNKGRNGNG